MATVDTIRLLGGLLLLVVGAQTLVRGASRLARAAGVSPLVVGLTVVAYGTSSPEIAVSAKAAWAGQADLALGNVVGSNLFNVLLILGVSALVVPLSISARLVRIEVPILIGVSLLPLVLGLDGRIGRLDGLFLVAGALAYTAFQVRVARKDAMALPASRSSGGHAASRASVLAGAAATALGLAVLVIGSRWLVAGASALARAVGMSELVIGLTIVAAGTSLPEAATSILAAARGERDIAVGNVVGSNLFNVLAVLGIAAATAPGGVPVSPAALRFDFPVMVAVAVACLPIFASGSRIARWEGALFVAYYAAYVAYLLLDAGGHDALPAFSGAMLFFALPLTVVTLLVVGFRTATGKRRAA